METRSSSSSSSQLVLLVLVIFLTLLNCSASKDTKKDGVKVPGREHMDKAKVDLSINLPQSVEITRANLGGRKMMSEGNTGMSNGGIKTEEGKKQSAAGEVAAPKNISGNKKSSATASADQNDAVKKSADEIVSLVNKDYDGNDIPGYRTPINNHEPLH